MLTRVARGGLVAFRHTPYICPQCQHQTSLARRLLSRRLFRTHVPRLEAADAAGKLAQTVRQKEKQQEAIAAGVTSQEPTISKRRTGKRRQRQRTSAENAGNVVAQHSTAGSESTAVAENGADALGMNPITDGQKKTKRPKKKKKKVAVQKISADSLFSGPPVANGKDNSEDVSSVGAEMEQMKSGEATNVTANGGVAVSSETVQKEAKKNELLKKGTGKTPSLLSIRGLNQAQKKLGKASSGTTKRVTGKHPTSVSDLNSRMVTAKAKASRAPASLYRFTRSKAVVEPLRAPVVRFLRNTVADNSPPGQKISEMAGHLPLDEAMKNPSKLNTQRLNAVTGVPGQQQRIHRDILDPGKLHLEAINVHVPPIPRLGHGLERALFNPGVYQMRDPHTRVYNFDPYLEHLMPLDEFDFNTLKTFTVPSKDPQLSAIAHEQGKRYVGSTSSMTGMLKHFHFLLSAWRTINFAALSRTFPISSQKFTKITMCPDAIFLRYKNGTYAIDADKEFDSANILSMMGKFMEKLLTASKESFERHRVGRSHEVLEAERSAAESYHYSTFGDFVMRSQLDAYDPRIPGTGTFDLKTRAVLPIRMDTKDFFWGMEYELQDLRGEWQSYEREYHDMIRATMLKYSLQVRIGRMDGIFVAYHNIARIFGFQYISLNEMDLALHGQSDRSLGDQEFMASLKLLNVAFNKAVERFPNQTLRLHFETREGVEPFMYIFAEPVTDEEVNAIQTKNNEQIEEWENKILGIRGHDQGSADGEFGSDSFSKRVQKFKDRFTVAAETYAEERKKDITWIDSEQDSTSTIVTTDTEESYTAHTNAPDEHSATESKHNDGKADGQARSNGKLGGEKANNGKTNNDSQEHDESRSVLGMILTVRSLVNETHTPRPSRLSARDEWKLHYSFAEIDKPERAWSLYQACQRRRSKALKFDLLERQNDFYMDRIRLATTHSRQWRNATDEEDRKKGNPLHLWNDHETVKEASTI